MTSSNFILYAKTQLFRFIRRKVSSLQENIPYQNYQSLSVFSRFRLPWNLIHTSPWKIRKTHRIVWSDRDHVLAPHLLTNMLTYVRFSNARHEWTRTELENKQNRSLLAIVIFPAGAGVTGAINSRLSPSYLILMWNRARRKEGARYRLVNGHFCFCSRGESSICRVACSRGYCYPRAIKSAAFPGES